MFAVLQIVFIFKVFDLTVMLAKFYIYKRKWFPLLTFSVERKTVVKICTFKEYVIADGMC